MSIDITKYLKNKDVKIKNEDFDFDAMEKDVYKGYVKESDATKGYVKKSELDELTKKYAELETNYNNTIKTLDDTNGKLSKVSLEKTMISKGFKEEQFEKVAKMRESLYGDEKDDVKAIETIATDFKATFFPETSNANPGNNIPNETGFNGNAGANSNNAVDIKITRDTSLKNLNLANK